MFNVVNYNVLFRLWVDLYFQLPILVEYHSFWYSQKNAISQGSEIIWRHQRISEDDTPSRDACAGVQLQQENAVEGR